MKLRLSCVLGVVILLAQFTRADAQEVAGLSVQQTQEVEQWVKAEQAWRQWIAEHRNTVYRNWMGMDGRDWLGRTAVRKQRPSPPWWLDTYCTALDAGQLEASEPCQQYERLKTYDFVADTIRQQAADARPEQEQHSHFDLKRHWGFGLGYDNRMIHGSIGMQITVAEWGRWNYGMLGASLGFLRRPAVNANTQQESATNDVSLFITIASASYRIKRISSLGMFWYVDFAQIYDMNHSMPVSQFGFSLARK